MTRNTKLPPITWMVSGALLLVWGACVVGPEKCKTGADCPPPFAVCVNQECVVCRVDGDCTGALVCREGACVQAPTADGSQETQGPDKEPPPPDALPSEGPLPETKAEPGAEPTGEPGPTDEMCSPGAKRPCFPADPSRLGVGPCTAGVQSCTDDGRWSTCEGAVLPSTELCNGKDDDCDGKIDGLPARSCYTGPANTKNKGPCQPGTQSCKDGAWSACTGEVLPIPEWCDDLDNDCDGKIDEDFPLKGKVCYVGIGPCEAKGVYTCSGGPYFLRCVATPKPASSEKCGDKIDNDCDGRVDEGCSCKAGDSVACGSRVGACQPGTQSCQRTTTSTGSVVYRWGACSKRPQAGAEQCDGIDNNCDGQVDEGCCIPAKRSTSWAAFAQNNPVLGLFATGDDHEVMVISNGTNARIWRWGQANATQIKELTSPQSITAGALDSDRQRYAAFGMKNFSIVVWENAEKIRHTLTGHTAAINALSFSDEGKELLSASDDKTVRLWLADKGLREQIFTYPAAATAVAFSRHDREIFAVGLANGSIYVQNADDENEKPILLNGHTGAIISLQWGRRGRALYSLSRDGTLRKWTLDPKGPSTLMYTTPKGQAPLGMAISPDDTFLAVIFDSSSRQLRIWDLASQKPKAAVSLNQPSGAITWSDDKVLLAGDTKGQVHVFQCP